MGSIPKPDCLLIEGCNFRDFPVGGQLLTVRNMMKLYGNRLGLVGIATDGEPVGEWSVREIGGTSFRFFGLARRSSAVVKPPLPDRLTLWASLKRYRKSVLSLGVRNAFLQAPEALIEVSRWGMDSVCYRFPGVDNPLEMPRYRWGRLFAGWLDRRLFRALARTAVILASADEESIGRLVKRSCGRLPRERVTWIPTHYDSDVFFPADRDASRVSLGIPGEYPVLAAVGRLNRVKGWDLLLGALRHLQASHPGVHLVFAGDGEDRSAIERIASDAGLGKFVTITGYLFPEQVALWINASNVAVFGSHREGWPMAMVEALACGKPVVSTEVSGARAMIREGENGFVVPCRDPERFADAVRSALRLRGVEEVNRSVVSSYDLEAMRCALACHWKVLA